MNALQIFGNEQFGEIRAIEIDGDPWFVGKDVASALGYKDTVSALKTHVDDEDKRGWRITTPSGEQEMTIINESGTYALIFGSKLKKAKDFKRWVTAEVLPTLRKTGTYSIDKVEPFPPNVSLSGLSNHIETLRRVMLESGDTPQAVRGMVVYTLKSLSVPVPPPLEQPAQLNLFSSDYPAVTGGEQA